MKITENKLRQIIRRVISESSGDVMGDAQRVVISLSRHPVISQLLSSGAMSMMINNTMVYELIRDEVESQCGIHGEDHCIAVQDMVRTLLLQS